MYIHKLYFLHICVTRWVAFVSLGVGASQGIPFVCFGAKPTQKACARDLPRDRKRTKEGRSQGQSAGESSQEKISQEMRAGNRGDQSTEVGGS